MERVRESTGRVLALWCPDWPVTAALRETAGRADEPAAVFRANRVATCNDAARAEGIRIGMRRRDAQSRWPQVQVLRHDPDRDARLFEPLAAAVEEQIPGIEVLRPGLLVCSARAAVRLLGSEEAVAERITDLVESWDVECRVGVADNLTVAVLAARRRTIVAPGTDAAFCAPLPIADLAREHTLAPPERAELVGLLLRLGLTTIGAFAALPEQKVVQRFGADGLLAHRLAQGRAERGLFRRRITEELGVEKVCDPPLDRVDTAAFTARALAAAFHDRLAAAGQACTRLMVSAVTDRGKEFSRVWRAARPLTADATADRVRWQLDGWLTSGRTRSAGPGRPENPEALDGFGAAPDDDTGPGAITLLRLDPIEVIEAGRVQFGLWGSEGQDDHRAGWAFSRVQGLLGPEAVLSPVRSGGRGPADRITLVPWGEEKVPERDPDAPWPGKVPAPSPSRLAVGGAVAGAADIDLVDADGDAVRLTERGLLTGAPVAVVALPAMPGDEAVAIASWAGPWLLDEQWWRTAAPPEPPPARVPPTVPGRPDWGRRPGRARRPLASQDADDRREASRAAHVEPVSAKDPTARLSRVLTAPPRRAARLQVVTPEGDGLLLCLTAEGWQIEGVYD